MIRKFALVVALAAIGYAGYLHKAEIYTAARPILAKMGAAAATPNPAREASLAAVRMYPDLARRGSAFNTMFLQLYAARKQADPNSLTAPDWPLTLAAEVEGKLGIHPFTGPQSMTGPEWKNPLDERPSDQPSTAGVQGASGLSP